MQDAVEEIAKQQKDAQFAIIDAEVKQPNVASVLFQRARSSIPCWCCSWHLRQNLIKLVLSVGWKSQ